MRRRVRASQSRHGHSICSRTVAVQTGEPLGALVDPGLNAGSFIEVSRLLPQSRRSLYLARVVLEYRKGPDRVGDIQWGSAFLAAIELQRLTIATLGILHSRRVVMKLPQMPDRVRQQKGVAQVTTNSNGFLVQLEGLVVAPEFSPGIAEFPERLNRLAAFAALFHGTLLLGLRRRHNGSSVSIGTPAELPHSVHEPS